MIHILLIFSIWMIGACFGSFFMVIGLRFPIGHSIIHPRSTCSNCFHYLGTLELIPFFSYVIQKGHCRHCHTKFSFLYPFTEALTGLLFVLVFFRFINQPKEILLLFFLIAFGIIFFISDLYYFLLPDSLMLLFFSSTIIVRLWFHPLPLYYYFISGISFFLLFYAFYCFTSQGIGGGDVKLFGILGLFFGFELTLFILFIACLSSLVFGLGLFALKKISKHTPFPFAPFIFLASFIVALYGENFQVIFYSLF
ncbi:leader peptidase (prepilin peptidase) / N-methyltransferase [Carnobacterium iners]|uniref:Leader peptidase (Prepilin peptidase) / N-methyltransferase n=1 Tax=Carnobacterium iners TaxID=1073423 RepID=A0A1X7MS89_9LACT|nr:A24 family peptidase [Carnobacterium iners]SEK92164.1 leader peptidase (prepilin peptidase) / N-methyltransferase [Carnobacterium iners]SMH27692.1 leader peptidase (prepilin peptidase) / N-methyltransferase [Carnobacterium iners]